MWCVQFAVTVYMEHIEVIAISKAVYRAFWMERFNVLKKKKNFMTIVWTGILPSMTEKMMPSINILWYWPYSANVEEWIYHFEDTFWFLQCHHKHHKKVNKSTCLDNSVEPQVKVVTSHSDCIIRSICDVITKICPIGILKSHPQWSAKHCG